MNGVPSSKHLPAPDGDIDISGIDLKTVATSPNPLRRQKRCARSAKSVEDDLIAKGTIPYGVGDQGNRLDRRMSVQVFHPASPERICPGIMPDVRAVAAMAAQFHRVLVGQGTGPKNTYQLMLASVKTALPRVGLYPHDKIEHRAVDAPSSGDQFLDMAPVHADIVHGAIGRDLGCCIECGFQKGDEFVAGHLPGRHRKLPVLRVAPSDNTSNRHVVRRIKKRHVGALATDQARKIARTACIATEQTMFAKAPEVANLRDTGPPRQSSGMSSAGSPAPSSKSMCRRSISAGSNPVIPMSIPSSIRSSGNAASSIESCSRSQPALWAMRLSASIRALFFASLSPSITMAGIDGMPSDR